MAWRAIGVGVTSVWITALFCWSSPTFAEDSRFAMTHSRSQYVHWIDLYDAQGSRIDPTDPDALPYSPVHTCGRCHDYEAIAHGYHFNAMSRLKEKGRAGEPWIWTDTRTGTQIPLSYRGWEGTYDPRKLGISAWDFLLQFGRQMPGGGPGEWLAATESEPEVSARELEGAGDAEQAAENPAANEPIDNEPIDNGRWALSGQLAIDCMMCHSNNGVYSPERWWEQIEKQNFTWAPAAAVGIADIDGEVSRLKDTPPAAADGEESGDADQPRTDLPKTSYRPVRMDADKKIFFDVIRKPSNDICYYCHTTRSVGDGATPDWTHDEDVHLRAGMSCTDCHRNGIEHHTVRGYEGEQHPTDQSVVTLSCRGCHMGDGGGRLGAPKPLHKGLPPLHLERMSCTSCHSGPVPREEALLVQTAMGHALGLPTHSLEATTPPQMAAPVMLRTDEVLYPHRVVWPAFWGQQVGETITPLNPEVVYDTLRRTLRVRRTSTFTETLGDVSLNKEDKAEVLGDERADVPVAELSEEEQQKLAQLELTKGAEQFREKLGEALVELKEAIETDGAQPVYVSGGRVYQLGEEDKVEIVEHEAAQPYAWKLAHDVRPARWSSGAIDGCYDCHKMGAPIFDGQVTALGPGVDPEPPTEKMLELAGYDRQQMDAWNLSFQGRTAFKWFGFASVTVVVLILLSFVLLGVNGVVGIFRRS
jgi:hypothetical protein